jgi:Leucine Rich repeat
MRWMTLLLLMSACVRGEPTPTSTTLPAAPPTGPTAADPADTAGMRTIPVAPGVIEFSIVEDGQSRAVARFLENRGGRRGLATTGEVTVPVEAQLEATVAPSAEAVSWANRYQVRLRLDCAQPLPPTLNHLACDAAQDADLAHLAKLPQLQSLNLFDTKVTDAGLAHVAKLSQLQSLDLVGTQVTDAGMVHVAKLSQLQSLNLWVTEVSDAGLAHVAKLSQLQSLGLADTQVSDAGLAHVAKLSQLQLLSLVDAQVSDAACKAFNQERKRDVCRN